MTAFEARREPVFSLAYPAAGAAPALSGPDERFGPIGGRGGGMPAFGPLGSLGLHLAVVLVLIFHPSLSGRPAPEVRPIPVSLVMMPPKPKPPPAPKPLPKPKPPPPGRIASVDMGPQASPKPAPRPGAPAAAAPPQLEAAVLPLPPPPKLDAPAQAGVVMRLPPAKPRPRPAALEGRGAKYPGPSANRDEYLAYIAMLTRQHIGLMTPQFLAGRHGETILDVVVLDNGTVARIDVLRSSGYADIDRKVEEIVRAVGRFPPLPQYVQAPSMDLTFHFPFPGSLRD